MSSDKDLRTMSLQLSRSVLKYLGGMSLNVLALHRPKTSKFPTPSVAGIKVSAARTSLSRTNKYQIHSLQTLYDYVVLCVWRVKYLSQNRSFSNRMHTRKFVSLSNSN